MSIENTIVNTAEEYKASAPVCPNNQVKLVGCIVGPFQFSHEVFGERFFTAYVSISRKSEVEDVLPIIISERLTPECVEQDLTGKLVEIKGQFRSFNLCTEGRSHLLLSVFVREFKLLEDGNVVYDYYSCSENKIQLIGYICKSPICRVTPLGREISDLLVAVNRPYGKSDYIPCICWGRNARFAKNQRVGTQVEIIGRVQSRLYKKKINENETEDKVAYEVSVQTISFFEPSV